MMSKRVWQAVLVGVLAAATLHGEVVILKTGDRLEGEIVQETATDVSVRMSRPGSKIRFVRKIPRRDIFQITAGGESPTSAPASQVADKPTTTQTSPTSRPARLTRNEQERFVRVALTAWEKDAYRTVGSYLYRLINGSSGEDLAHWSATFEEQADMSLGDMAAESHLQTALEQSHGRKFRLRYVTAYEKPFLAPRLADAYADVLKESFRCEPEKRSRSVRSSRSSSRNRKTGKTIDPPKESNNKPTSFAIKDWLDKPDDFDGDKLQARAFASHIQMAIDLLAERFKWDDQIKKDRKLADQLESEKKALLALKEAVDARAKGGLTRAEREAKVADRQRLQEMAKTAAEQREEERQEHIRKTLEAAQALELQQNPPTPGGVAPAAKAD